MKENLPFPHSPLPTPYSLLVSSLHNLPLPTVSGFE
jgi:hypothetical protein